MKAILNGKKFFGLTSDDCVRNERLKEKVFLARLRKMITTYILSLSLLTGAYVGCSKDRVSSGDDLESRTKIVFASNRDGNMDIYVMNADGSNQTKLTNNPSFEMAPSWSPDGKKIAFYSLRNDVPDEKEYGKDGRPWYEYNAEIYVMNRDGSELTNITNNPAYDGYPSWSPFLETEK